MDTYMFYKCLVLFLACILLIVLIFLGIKMILTLNKVDKLVDDLNEKSKKLDGAFGAVDKVTDAISSVNDKVIGLVFGLISNLTHKIKDRKERNEDDE